ncbi:MAG TPA: DUF6498-containing protein [Planctomycetota bacterium]|nr:DUF6498-containing protein [Planctomycetota bacterium]
MNPLSNKIRSFPAIILIAANIFPLFAVLFMGWDVFMLLLLYLAETAVIGIYGVLKLLIVAKFWSIFIVPIFIFAYGMIMMIPFVIIGGLYDSQHRAAGHNPADMIPDLLKGVIAYAVSHGISFVWNYLGKKEYQGMTIEKQMQDSFQRIILLFIATLAGIFLYIMKEIPLQLIGFVAIFCVPVAIAFGINYLYRRLKGITPDTPPDPQVKSKPIITKKRLMFGLITLAILGVLLISPQISTLIFLIVIKTAIDLYSHISEHSTV